MSTYINRKRLEILGKEFTTNRYGNCVVIGYNNALDATVKFYNPEYVTKCRVGDLVRGEVCNPLFPIYYGRGYIGVGRFNTKNTKAYSVWRGMLERTDSNKVGGRSLNAYKDVTVCEEWLNFQNFARWCEGQSGSSLPGWELDKDVLRKGNVVYSEDACCFIPRRINTIFPKRYAQGDRVYLTSDGEWQCQVRLDGKRKTFKSKDREKVVTFKVKATKEILTSLANTYKDSLAPHVYEALLSWEGY